MLSRKNRRRLRNYLVGLIGPRLARIWGWSLRKRILSKDIEEKDGWVYPPGLIVLVWHQRLFTLATSFPDAGFKTLVSPHADGEMLARIVEGIGHDAIRGSTTRRSVAAIRELIRAKKEHVRIGITLMGHEVRHAEFSREPSISPQKPACRSWSLESGWPIAGPSIHGTGSNYLSLSAVYSCTWVSWSKSRPISIGKK